MSTYFTSLATPIGELFIEGNDEAITRIWFEGENITPTPGARSSNDIVREAKKQLTEYFAGERGEFDLPLSAEGTEFQQAVWKALQKIRYGQTRTYGQIAAAIHQPMSAARGVGQACGHNPLPLVVPCHRVVNKSGHLTGYGGGVWRKEWLLDHEQKCTPSK